MPKLTTLITCVFLLTLTGCQNKPNDSSEDVAGKNNNNQEQEQNPTSRVKVGDRADYLLDKDSARTSSMINRGTASALVTNHLPRVPAYLVALTYDLGITYFGDQNGTQDLEVPDAYFDPGFMEQLRSRGQMETATFSVRHLGFDDVTTMDGNSYPNCDVIEIYNIDTTSAANPAMVTMAHSLLQDAAIATTGNQKASVENLKIRARVHESVPVIGAAQLDIQGTTSGFNLKAGFDYEKP